MHRHNRHSTVKTATGCCTCSLLTLWYSGGFGCAWGVHHCRNRHNRHNRHSAIIHHKLEHTWIYVHIAGTHLRLRQHLFFERQTSMRISDRPMEHTLTFVCALFLHLRGSEKLFGKIANPPYRKPPLLPKSTGPAYCMHHGPTLPCPIHAQVPCNLNFHPMPLLN